MLQIESHEGQIPEMLCTGLIRITKAYPPMPMETHHGMYELFFLLTGEKQMIVRDRPYLLHGGDMLVIPPDVRIGRNTAVAGATEPEDYPNGELVSGGAIIKAPLSDESGAEGGAAS